VERCKHVKSRTTTGTGVFQARQAIASIYICTTDVGIIGHVTVEAGKHSRNRWCATTIFPLPSKIHRLNSAQ
jgi:hypothetical protein